MSQFPLFSTLPPELRRHIYSLAINSSELTTPIDIWPSFARRTHTNTTFYTQSYTSHHLTPSHARTPHALLSVSQEARRECLRYLSLQWECVNELFVQGKRDDGDEEGKDGDETGKGNGKGKGEIVRVISEAKHYVNLQNDLIVPCGSWNCVSFANFWRRGWVRAAVDVKGQFWSHGILEALKRGEDIFEGGSSSEGREIALFVMSEEGREEMERLRKDDLKGGGDRGRKRKVMTFHEFEEGKEVDGVLLDAERLLRMYLGKMNGEGEKEIEVLDARRGVSEEAEDQSSFSSTATLEEPAWSFSSTAETVVATQEISKETGDDEEDAIIIQDDEFEDLVRIRFVKMVLVDTEDL